MEFRFQVDEFERSLGFEPLGKDVIFNMALVVSGLRPDVVSDQTMETGIISLYRHLENTIVRVPVEERDGKLHLGPALWCGCSGPVCTHGWSFKMASTVMMMKDRVVGASGFDVNEFINGGLGPVEEDFEDAYSSLEVPRSEMTKSNRKVEAWKKGGVEAGGVLDPAEIREKSLEFVRRQDKRNGTNHAKDLVGGGQVPPAPPLPTFPANQRTKSTSHRFRQHPIPKLETITERSDQRVTSDTNGMSDVLHLLSQMRADNQALNKKVDQMQEDVMSNLGSVAETITPPQSPPTRMVTMDHRSEFSVGPEDSSTVIERYGKKFMHQGTVFSVRKDSSAAEAADDKTHLTTETYLVEGYLRTPETAQVEAKSVQKLVPINGLPRPFVSSRLNFLANFHTGLGRAKNHHGGTISDIIISVMENNSIVPVDDLLNQVLCVSIDKRRSIYVSNPFNLPYIEIGMLVTEDSLIKMLDLIQSEYKQLWFQEFKSIVIPRFHSDYRPCSSDPVKLSTRGSKVETVAQLPQHKERRSKSRSILGL